MYLPARSLHLNVSSYWGILGKDTLGTGTLEYLDEVGVRAL